MMSRINLSLQIAIIFLIAFAITYSLAVYIILGSLDDVFESNIYEQLEAKSRELSALYHTDIMDIYPMFVYMSYNSQTDEYFASDNINDYIDDEFQEDIIEKSLTQDTSIEQYKGFSGGTEVFYVILNQNDPLGLEDNNTFILLTNEALKDKMRKSMSNQILLGCLFAYLLGYLLIFVWNSSLVADTKKIAKTLEQTGRDYYRTKIETNRMDEIGELVYNIELMREKIVNNEKHKQEIIQGVSHHLNTPIAIIRSYAEALEDGIYSPEHVSNITLQQCDRLNLKVKKLLTLTRIGYLGINNQEFENVDIEKLVVDTVSLYSSQSPIQIKANTQPAMFKGDVESWQIVLDNLMDNAIRYAKSQIKITLIPDGLIIYNDGDPIPSNTYDRLFSPYEKGEGGNYGLGLSIVKNTVNLFGYTVSAQNIDGGVVFTIK